MEDKRPLLAILLILVIFLGFNYWNAQRAGEAAVPGQADVASTEEAGQPVAGAPGISEVVPETAAEASAGASAAAAAELVPEEITTVETPLWVARLSNRGGSIVSWELKNYDDSEGAPVQLVREGSAALSTEIRYGARRIDTSSIMFEGPGETVHRPSGDGSFSMIAFQTNLPEGIRLTRQYTFFPDSYAFELYVSVAGLDAPAAEREIVIGWPGVLPTESSEDERADRASVVMQDGKAVRMNLGKLKDEERSLVGDIPWATAQSKYFMAAVIPTNSAFTRVLAYADTSGRAARFDATVPVSETPAANEFVIYAGPQDFVAVSDLEAGLERAVYLGWPWIRPLSTLMLRALIWAHNIIPNYGIVIILFSVFTKLIFYRLTHRSFTEMKRMQDLQPQLKALQKKHENNREELSKAQMGLYKVHKVNPLSSCFPMLLQMPVFIALFQVLRTTIELRGAPFALWMTDLSQPDTIATVAGFAIHILPVLMGIGMLVQQKFSSTDPSQAAMGRLMPIVFTVIFYNMASGLVLYWLVNTVLSIAQQYYIHRGPSTAMEMSRDAAAPQGVPADVASSSTTGAPQFEDADVVAGSSGDSGGPGKKSGGRRRGKRKK
ncbi:MAG: membrane protein insertase YidC [Candidatus Eisenbacteria bacterium]